MCAIAPAIRRRFSEFFASNAGCSPAMWLPTWLPAREFSRACFWKMATPFFRSSPTPRCARWGLICLRILAAWSGVAGTAEETTLGAASVDFVTAAQAAHWFDLRRARAEFCRILRPQGWCVLIWN